MPRNLLPKYLLTTLLIALAVICIVSAALYANYTQLANELVSSGVEQTDTVLKARLEDRARTLVRSLERELDAHVAGDDAEAISAISDDARGENPELTALNITRAAADAAPQPSAVIWNDAQLMVTEPLVFRGGHYGELTGVFDLTSMLAELTGFRDELLEIEQRYRARGLLWVTLATLGMLPICALLAWVAARRLV
ncbi:MAG: hypothetical protein AAFX10_15910, partial [Pseudomonadota bacterium]